MASFKIALSEAQVSDLHQRAKTLERKKDLDF